MMVNNHRDVGVLAFVPDLWNDIWQTRHHVTSGLSWHYKVLWVSPPTYLETWLNGGLSTILGGRGLQRVSDRFWAYAPRMPADYKRRSVREGPVATALRRYHAWWMRRHVETIVRLTKEMGFRRVILYVWRPEFVEYVSRIPHVLLCYHIDDEYSFSPDQDMPIGREETTLLQQADLVFIHSRSLMEKKGRINPNTHYVPNGVDFEHFRQAMKADLPEPDDLRKIPHPRIAYVGYVKRHLDLPLLREIARARPQWSLVIVGPVREEHADIATDVTALRALPNVHFLGSKPTADVPHYIKGVDVCLLPYRRTNYTKYIYPIKLHEYLACGKPVVATPIDNLHEFEDVLRFAETPTEWASVLTAALGDTGANAYGRRVTVAADNSWAKRVEQIDGLLRRSLSLGWSERV